MDLNQILESTITVCSNEWKYHAEMEIDFSPGLPRILCFSGDLGQVFLNIIVNSAHAIEKVVGETGGGMGKIVVRTQKTDFGVQVQISDTGGGIPEHIQDKVFDPFLKPKSVEERQDKVWLLHMGLSLTNTRVKSFLTLKTRWEQHSPLNCQSSEYDFGWRVICFSIQSTFIKALL